MTWHPRPGDDAAVGRRPVVREAATGPPGRARPGATRGCSPTRAATAGTCWSPPARPDRRRRRRPRGHRARDPRPDLQQWTVRPPLSRPGAGFGHSRCCRWPRSTVTRWCSSRASAASSPRVAARPTRSGRVGLPDRVADGTIPARRRLPPHRRAALRRPPRAGSRGPVATARVPQRRWGGRRARRSTVHHGLERAAVAHGDDRPAGGLGLHRGDPELLDRRHDERAAGLSRSAASGSLTRPGELHRRPGQAAQPPASGPSPTITERKTQLVEGVARSRRSACAA